MAYGLRSWGTSMFYGLRCGAVETRDFASLPRHAARLDLEVTGLRETHAPDRVGDRVSVTARRMDRSRSARLSGERQVCRRPERLSRGQGELVSDRRRRTGVALQNLPADCVV